jgi:hypothetical protein
VVKRTLWLKRRFISVKEIEAEVREAVVTAFFKEGLYRTRDATGVLVLISVFERHGAEWCSMLQYAAQAIPPACHVFSVIDAEIAEKGHFKGKVPDIDINYH